MKNKRFLFIMILLILSCFFSSVTANKPATCGYGTCDTWFSFDGINWHNTTYRNAELHRGESFFIKTMISTTKPDIHVSIRFFEEKRDNASFYHPILSDTPPKTGGELIVSLRFCKYVFL